MLGNYFLNRRYYTSVIALLQIASEVTTDTDGVLAGLGKKYSSREKGRNPSLASYERPSTEKKKILFFLVSSV